MILKDVESLEAFGYENPYKNFSLVAHGYDKGIESVLERLDNLPACLEWINTKDKLPDEEGWYLCVIENKILPLYYAEDKKNRKFWEQHFGPFCSQVIYWISDEIDYWADFSKLPIPKE